MSTKPPASYTSVATTTSLNNAATSTNGDYKALVCIFMPGAMDSHNFIVPTGINSQRGIYESARPVTTPNPDIDEMVGIALTEILPLTGIGSWGLHPSLVGIQSMFNDGDMAIIRDVGVLNKPTTKTQFLNDLSFRPDQLFSHNTQQDIWQAAVPPKQPRDTGWFGRTANLIDDIFNPDQVVESGSTGISKGFRQSVSYYPKNSNVFPAVNLGVGLTFSGVVGFNTNKVKMYHGESNSSPFSIPTSPNNLMHNAFRDIFISDINSQATVSFATSALPSSIAGIFTAALTSVTSQSLPQSGFITQVMNVAAVINSRGSGKFNQRRQMIICSIGGWDNHNSLREYEDPQLRTLDIAIKALVDALKQMGVYDNVVIFNESEFSRTLKSNGTYGTDHAWSGHSFVIGGPVKGGLYGPEPDYTLGGPRDAEFEGRFIPNYSIEQYYGTLLEWFDIPHDLVPLVLPNIVVFDRNPIGFLTTV